MLFAFIILSRYSAWVTPCHILSRRALLTAKNATSFSNPRNPLSSKLTAIPVAGLSLKLN